MFYISLFLLYEIGFVGGGGGTQSNSNSLKDFLAHYVQCEHYFNFWHLLKSDSHFSKDPWWLHFSLYLYARLQLSNFPVVVIIVLTYHSLHIQDGCTLINVLLCCNWTSWEFYGKCLLKLLYMVFQISFHGCDLQQLGRIYLAQSLNVNRSSILIHSMIPMRIVFQDFIDFLKFKFL